MGSQTIQRTQNTQEADIFQEEKENLKIGSPSHSKGAELRTTRSNSDKDQLIQPPNPFQARILQTKDQSNKKKIISKDSGPKSDHLKKTRKKDQTSHCGKLLQDDMHVEDANTTGQTPVVQVCTSTRKEQEEKKKSTRKGKSKNDHQDTIAEAKAFEPVQAKIGADQMEEDEFPIMDDVEQPFQGSSPRESTPPPQSPSKEARETASRLAIRKLEESLLKLDENVNNDVGSEAQANPDHIVSDDEETEKLTALAEIKDVSEPPRNHEPNEQTNKFDKEEDTGGRGDNDKENRVESRSSDPAAQHSLAPKRTLSSISHAKKSLMRASSIHKTQPAQRISSSKGSFLAKSLMNFDREQQDKVDDDLLDHDNSLNESIRSSGKRRVDENEVNGTQEQINTSGHSRKSLRLNADGDKFKKSTSVDAIEEPRKDQHDDKDSKSEAEDERKFFEDAKEGSENARRASEATKQATDNVLQITEETKAPSLQPQSLREKIESFHVQKSQVRESNNPETSSRNFSSLSTHSVGLGTAKISSPIFSRSGSQTQIPTESSPTRKKSQEGFTAHFTKRQRDEKSPPEDTRTAQKETETTTPQHSPGPELGSMFVTMNHKQSPAPAVSGQIAANRKGENSIDDSSDSDAVAYDTSSDGDLSLVDLVGAHTNTIKPPGVPIRPPGSIVRQPPAPLRSNGMAAGSKAGAFMPSHGVNREANSSARTIRGADHPPSMTSAASGPSSPHASWGGSISSKLKGMLGFSTSGSSIAQPSTTSRPLQQAKNAAAGPVVPPKEHHSIAGNVAAPKPTPASSGATHKPNLEKKPSGTVRVDSHRKKDADTADRKVTEGKNIAEQKKRIREEVVTAPKQKNVSRIPSKAVTTVRSESPTGKRRKTNEAPSSVGPERLGAHSGAKLAGTATTTSPARQLPSQMAKPHVPGANSSKPATKVQLQKPQPVRPGQGAFSDNNPFQKAANQQREQALASVTKQLQRKEETNSGSSAAQNQKMSPASKTRVVATNHIELEEPDSAYSDSEDEETIRRRQMHKPWETREGLAAALEAQAKVDADMIFGIPQGGVPLDDILPPQTEQARARRMRPRSSSATWSRDGLKQIEIDRYNERMGIDGSGVKLAERVESPSSPMRGHRLSTIAQSALSQGHVTRKLPERPSQR